MGEWHHAPVHHFEGGGTFFVTGATLYKRWLFTTPQRLDALRDNLFEEASAHECRLQA